MKLSRRRSLQALTAAVAMPSLASEQAPRFRLIALDVGGTILQDRGDVVDALRSAMARRDIVVSAAEIGPWRGASKRAVIRHFVDLRSKQSEVARQTLAREIYKDFVAQVNEAYKSVPPIQGAEETIRKLRENNYLVATTTGFDREIVMPIFRRLGWEKYFAAMVASDDVLQGRPAPYMLFHAMEMAQVNSVAEVMAVGDTPLDLQAASNGGLRGMVGVLSGAGTEEQLRREPHTQILGSVAELPALLGLKH
ncbi:MAG TPA: HAD-IA family hydrolase [Bryobacteraceae bacterium]|nr:HAD-IA family hydrolase [Bryobacteraceae bacterium]